MTPVAICLSFDVDGDASWRFAAPGAEETRNLSQLSWGRYGVVRGLPRILGLLGELEILATFFVPGAVVDGHPGAIEQIAAGGHEVAHHGYHHFYPARLSPEQQHEEIERGIDAIRRCVGAVPVGYRAPAWQMTATTFALLCERGFVYDSSMMGDDRPYLERVGGSSLVEIPVHWALDDFPHFGAVEDHSGPLRDPREVFEVWWMEVESAIAEGRSTSFCFHPEVIGRAWTFTPFEQFVRKLHGDPRVTFGRCLDVASAFTASREMEISDVDDRV